VERVVEQCLVVFSASHSTLLCVFLVVPETKNLTVLKLMASLDR